MGDLQRIVLKHDLASYSRIAVDGAVQHEGVGRESEQLARQRCRGHGHVVEDEGTRVVDVAGAENDATVAGSTATVEVVRFEELVVVVCHGEAQQGLT